MTCEDCERVFRMSGIDLGRVPTGDFEFFHVIFCGADDDEWDELEMMGFYFEI